MDSNAIEHNPFGCRLEMLTFEISGQLYGINIFKVKEIVQFEESETLSSIPRSHPFIKGLKKIRDKVVPVIDTAKVLCGESTELLSKKFLLVIEVSNTTRGLLIDNVSNIAHIPWECVVPSPKTLGRSAYVTSVVNYDDAITPVLDVEKILNEIYGEADIELAQDDIGKGQTVLIVDDSLVAYNQVARCAQSLGFDTVRCSDGKEAIEHLHGLINKGVQIASRYPLLIIDVEMPQLDGYQLTSKIRSYNAMSNVNIMINSSLSSHVSKETAYKVGADLFLSKFSPAEIQAALKNSITGDVSEKCAA